jgi:cobalt/nickel transport system ATP-binding protein
MTESDKISACKLRDIEINELIHVDCLKHVYPDGTSALHDICLSVYKGEIIALCGANGAGKSTLVEHLNGLLKPSVGRLVILNNEVTKKTGIITDVGIVFQDADSQVFAPTVIDDVMFGPLNKGLNKEEAKAVALNALESINASYLANRIPYYLSKGEKRLVAIAGVLAMEPKVIAADEPTSDLDPVHSRQIESVLLDLKNNHGISIVITTHDMDLAARLADRIYVIHEGGIIATGTPKEIFYDVESLSKAGLEQPTIVRLYERLKRDHNIDNIRPISEEDLISLVSSALRNQSCSFEPS